MNTRMQAPEMPSTIEWVNVDQAPTLEALRGRVVVLHFWSYDCVNCINVLPDLRYLENKYHDGLSVVGVHTPKYTQQRQTTPVLKAVNRHYIRYPVANDPDFSLWQAYRIKAWPTLAVIDAEGRLVSLLPGEGQRQQTDALIGQLLDEAANKDLRVYESNLGTAQPELRMPLCFPAKLFVNDTSVWIADTAHNRVLECTPEGRILRQFGSGNPGYWDGCNQDAGFANPQGIALLKDTLYVADTGNHAVRRIRLLNGEVDTVVGTGTVGYDRPNDSAEPTKTAMSAPTDVAGTGDKLYIAVSGQHQIWQLDLGRNLLSVMAGSGECNLVDGDGFSASFAQPSSLSLLGQQLIVADAAASAVRLLQLQDNRVSTIVGSGLYEFGDAAGPREQVRLQNPLAVCADQRGLVFIADSYNNKIKALNLRTGEVRTLNLPYQFHEPAGLSLAAGALWVANTNAHEIVRVDLASGKILRVPIGE